MLNLSWHHLRAYPFAILTLLTIGLIGTATAGESFKRGDQAPDWILPNSEGEPVSFYQDSADRPAVLLFWATWCPYCAELMPELDRLSKELANENVRFYALNIWEDGDPVAFMRDKDFDFTLLLDADSVAKRYEVRSTPGLFVVDKEKQFTYIRPTKNPTKDLYEAVKSALGDKQ